MTFRELEAEIRRTDRSKRGLSSSHLVNLAKGRDAPSDRAMTLIARVFGIERGVFVEARVQALVERTDVRRRPIEDVLAELDVIDRACADQHAPGGTSNPPSPRVRPDSFCYLCGFQPSKAFGDAAAEVLLKPHFGPDDRPMLLCANCHIAVHADLHPAYSGLPGAHVQPPPSIDDPGPIVPRGAPAGSSGSGLAGPPAGSSGPGWTPLGGMVDTSKWPREEFTEDEPPPHDHQRHQTERSPSLAPDEAPETR